MKKIAEALLNLLPHMLTVWSLMIITLFIIDRFNTHMEFLTSDISKWLILIGALLALVEAIYVFYIQKKS